VATPDESRKRLWRFKLNDTTTLEVSAAAGPTEKQIRRRGRWSLVLGTLVAALMVSAVAGAAVWTDQQDYAPGSVVTISGDNSNDAGYLPGETVVVSVSGPNGYEASCEAVADENGAWSCQVTLWDTDLAQGTYTYTATGQLSGTSESGTFIDAINIVSRDSTCSTDTNSFTTGDVVCPRVTGIGGPFPKSGEVKWWAPGLDPDSAASTFSDAFSVSTGNFNGVTHTVIACGTWTLRVFQPAGTLQDTHTFTVTGCAPANSAPTANANGPYSVNEGGSVALSGSGSDPDAGQTLTFSWDLDNDGTFETAGQNPIFSAVGRDGPDSQTVVLKVCDNGTPSLCDTDSTTVSILNVPPTVTLSGPNSADEGETKSYSYSTSDPGIETFTHTASCGANGTLSNDSFDGATGAGSFDCTFPDGPASSTVEVTVDDGDGGSDSDSIGVTVANVAPTVAASFASASVSCGSDNATLNVSFTDPGVDTHTASVDWGDGSSVEALGPVTSPFSTSHTYAAAGMYNAAVTVTDSDGDSGSDPTNAVTVNFTIVGGGILQPINPGPPTSVFKYKSTIPVKIKIADCDGSFPSTLEPQISVQKLNGGTPSGTEEASSTSAADSGTTMRFDLSNQQYIYNLATKPLSDSSATYQIKITITQTGQTIYATFGLKP